VSKKKYITAQQLLEDSFQLGLQILESGFRPSFIVGVWRGGAPVGIAVQEFLDYFGLETDHISVRTSYYTGIDQRRGDVRVHGLNYLVKQVDSKDALLIVDDVYDTGLSVQAIINHLQERCRRNTPENIRTATAYFKPNNNRTKRIPDFYVHKVDQWLVFPHELHGLTCEEIEKNKPGADTIIHTLKKYGGPG
jgi:hypoxanthine phosphoribosyltransferase